MVRPLDLLYAAALGAASPVLATRLLRTGKWRTDWRGRRGHAEVPPSGDRPTVLLHGVSVGEVAAAEPLVARLRERARVVVSATTDTGTERARRLYGGDVPVVRYPLDFSWMVRRFLDAVRPDVVALLELEVWPNLVRECEVRGIPVCVVSGRLSASSFRGYRVARPLVRPSFRRLTAVGAQTRTYAGRFEELGVPPGRIEVTDSMKWDAAPPADGGPSDGARALARELGLDPERPVVVAVSTGEGEEERLLAAAPGDVQLVLVPRRPERFEAVAGLDSSMPRRSARSPSPGASRFLVDTMGEAELATELADVVVIGRSFNGEGGSNPIPAAALGKPIVVGPDHQHFGDVVEALVGGGAALVTDRPIEAARTILGDVGLATRMRQAGPRVVSERRGATERTAELVLSLLERTGRGRVGSATRES